MDVKGAKSIMLLKAVDDAVKHIIKKDKGKIADLASELQSYMDNVKEFLMESAEKAFKGDPEANATNMVNLLVEKHTFDALQEHGCFLNFKSFKPAGE